MGQIVFPGRKAFLKVFGIDSWRDWADRHGIEPMSSECSKCGEMLYTKIPIFYGKLRGLMSDPCKCGSEDVPYCYLCED